MGLESETKDFLKLTINQYYKKKNSQSISVSSHPKTRYIGRT
jgi:hypothetical protein